MKAKCPTISVVIPLYNKELHIVKTLISVAAQTYSAHEILVIDDGSTDKSAAAVAEAIAHNPALYKTRLIHQTNGGVSSARNTGIKEATGSHIAFLDADDHWLPGFIEKLVVLIRQFPRARAQATNYYKQQAGKRIQPKIRMNSRTDKNSILNNYFSISARGDLPFMTSSVCIEKTLLNEIGGFPLNEPMGEDQDVWSKVALKTDIAYSPVQLSVYQLDANNRACNAIISYQECPFSRRLLKGVTLNQIPRELHTAVLAYTATHLIHIAETLIANGELKAAHTIMADPRLKLLPLKSLRLRTKYRLSTLKHYARLNPLTTNRSHC
ncbi:glycosyltransferase family 2 protein [Teredinibacter franksiae]|uniref:glycosyltransferase family 2 protein n=1 Tax=Teredinibacter franksiae TaxID=2761453 RepID=UPI001628FB43|nr:glycosyltransferase family 2 protein [Teredinibacter franksiae]